MKPILEELEDVNDYSKRFHHETNHGAADGEPIDAGELNAYAGRALAIVGAPPISTSAFEQ